MPPRNVPCADEVETARPPAAAMTTSAETASIVDAGRQEAESCLDLVIVRTCACPSLHPRNSGSPFAVLLRPYLAVG